MTAMGRVFLALVLSLILHGGVVLYFWITLPALPPTTVSAPDAGGPAR
jgi:hypothetical protein